MLVATLAGASGTNYNWRKTSLKIRSMSDYDDTTAPTNGQYIAWDSGTSKWKPKSLVPPAIRASSDYNDAVAPSTGQVVQWNGTKYAPASLPIHPLFAASFAADGAYYWTAHDPLTVNAVTEDSKAGSSPTFTYEYSSDHGATWMALPTLPASIGYNNTIRVTVAGLGAGEWACVTAN